MASSKELTKAYMENRLPEGWYYFRPAGCLQLAQKGKYQRPTKAAIEYRTQHGLPVPQPVIYSGAARFIGQLQTIEILAPIPEYNELKGKNDNETQG